MVKQREK